MPDGRTRHYGHFYGVRELATDAPVALVHGNCQAESLRTMLDGGGLAGVRIPPVHELTTEDLPHLARWLGRAQLLVSQPIRAGWGGLPVGTDELAAALPPSSRVVRVPVIRFAGLYPTHAIVRPPGEPGLVPPVVAYHDLRVLVEAAGERLPPLTPARVHAIAELSRTALRIREQAHGTVVASDLFARPVFALMRTLNHPGNPVWTALAARVRAHLGLPEHEVDPGGPLLDDVHAPREPAVIEAFALAEAPEPNWRVGGVAVPAAEVREAHLRFYAERPGVVEAGLTRHADALALLR